MAQQDQTFTDDRQITLEHVLDKIAETLITSQFVDPDILRNNQKVIKEGIISIGRHNSERIAIYESDVSANKDDLKGEGPATLKSIVDSFTGQMGHVLVNLAAGWDGKLWSIELSNHTQTYNIIDIITESVISDDGTETILNPLNVSQFASIKKQKQNVDSELAKEHLDTTIFELIPTLTTRQDRINQFFQEFQNLTGNPPNFEITDGLVSDYFMISGSTEYSEAHDIAAAQETPDVGIQEPESFITRLDSDANDRNSGKTLQSLRDSLNDYLKDIDQEFPEPQDNRPNYTNKSSGYLKFRNLNQGIIIRNTQQDFVEGLNPDTQEYLDTGFTITMWVRFLDQASQGTLFNFGNPLRQELPFGFMLDTYVLKKNANDNIWTGGFDPDGFDLVKNSGNPNGSLFVDSDSERFVRLIVRERDDGNPDFVGGKLRDSHLPNTLGNYGRKPGIPMQGWNNTNYITNNDEDTSLAPNQINVKENLGGDEQFRNSQGLFNHVRIPKNPTEWYFICATYNPDIMEDQSFGNNPSYLKRDPDYWRNNRDLDGNYVYNSGYGAKCKVEIISRTDLLRARGYKVD